MEGNYRNVLLTATLLALMVVVLGAYVRLSDAGLGCPDWPGCYGHHTVPSAEHEVAMANNAYPDRPVEAGKAWKEVIHRYFAGILGLLVAVIVVLAWKNRHRQSPVLPMVLAGLIVFQALLGMWTVTMKLNPTIVMAHLLGGLATLSLLWWLCLRQLTWPRLSRLSSVVRLRWFALLGLILVIGQISLGGWTSANYAALACPDFPTCQTAWLPPTDFAGAFDLWQETADTYEGGILHNDARVTIHWTHRLGAVMVLVYLAGLLAYGWRNGDDPVWRILLAVVGGLLLIQISLGIANVVLKLPLAVAVAHNGVAALLVLSLLTLNRSIWTIDNHREAT